MDQDRIRAMKMWDKYGKFLSDPVRNLNVRLVFQYGNVTESQRDEPRNNDVAVSVTLLPSSLNIDFHFQMKHVAGETGLGGGDGRGDGAAGGRIRPTTDGGQRNAGAGRRRRSGEGAGAGGGAARAAAHAAADLRDRARAAERALLRGRHRLRRPQHPRRLAHGPTAAAAAAAGSFPFHFPNKKNKR